MCFGLIVIRSNSSAVAYIDEIIRITVISQCSLKYLLRIVFTDLLMQEILPDLVYFFLLLIALAAILYIAAIIKIIPSTVTIDDPAGKS